ncbi:substrate-binding periplasmic protein [Roseateles koreensis]|uniref:Transporter substrate-binding domain-containing protein n=1 Tax=Roseateles koreensis TaxID=2987526 RepID=A0ABT5KPK2_9BURK|nr:transporter substrate-binding domain-containing protein [Roseateles koreensis]MDC8784841.1 transporter substrate-binding domain-containing protein [Roseateles koreensis]
MKKRNALLTLLAVVALPAFAGGQVDVRLGIIQHEALQDVAAELLRAIYKRAGLTLRIEPYPSARLERLTRMNQVDGEVSRVAAYFSRNPQLIQVEPAFYALVTSAFARVDRAMTLNSLSELKDYRVGVVKGDVHAAVATEGLPVVQADDNAQLFRYLESGRIDIAIDAALNGADAIKELSLEGVVKNIGDFNRRELFHVLVPAKREVAAKVSATIRLMQASGELQAMIKRLENARVNSDAPRRY